MTITRRRIRVAGPISLAVTVTAASLALTGCGSPDDASASPSPSPTATRVASATPTPTAAATDPDAFPAFDTIDGTWCRIDAADDCLIIALPTVTQNGSADYGMLDPETTGWGAPCYTSALVYTPTDFADIGAVYCPAGTSPADGVETSVDATVDRIFLSQNPPAAHTYVREEDRSTVISG